MKIHANTLKIASGFGLLLAAGTAMADAKMSQDVMNARQEAQISTTYALSPYLRANQINVSVKDGKATLTGAVEEEVNKELATEIALGVTGIKDVDNEIVIEKDVAPRESSKERSYGDVVDDASITAAIKSKLVWSKHADSLATKVETQSGKVTLRGTAVSEAAKSQAGSIAKNTRGVMSVDNQLKIDPNKPSVADSAKRTAEKGGTAISDSWITAKVKSTLMYSSNVTGTDITVNTVNGVVTLTGKVDSGAEQSLAVELAQNVHGVNRVEANGLVF